MTVENLLSSANDNTHGQMREMRILVSELTKKTLLKALRPTAQDWSGETRVLAVQVVHGGSKSDDHAIITPMDLTAAAEWLYYHAFKD